MQAQNDNKSNPQDKITLQRKLVCHSEGARSATEESLSSARDSLSKTPKGTTSDSSRDFTPPLCAFAQS
ncbi:hypothetical protein [Helicobacter marmotae]|uniref:hypothetical protein n=1 Tax=Helicobacter marmotae TaxID=152490 RepID=UPI0011C056F5|nr:hypothetical protein [Helicobacter marmotae]